jgi:cytochrome c553
MKRLVAAAGLVLLPLAAYAADAVPTWAYFFPDQNQPQAQENAAPKRLPGSDKSYTQAQIDDLKNPPDWFPNAHPPMPPVVAKGGQGIVFACGACHLTSGMGHPESSSLAGLTAPYMERQIADFKSGARGNPIKVDGKPQNNATQFMIGIAKGLSDAESHAAAQYFAQLKPIPWVKVVEAANVPKSYVNRGYMRVAAEGGAMEPLGNRIVELPQDLERQLMRDPRSGTVAYVPVGSVARGRTLATTGGNGKTTQCTFCHGPNLKGLGDVPHLAGRSPIYAFRQLYQFKDGTRGGPSAALMKGVVEKLSTNDMIDLSAYVASLAP